MIKNASDRKRKIVSKTQISQVSTAVLAYIGDAVYEMWARQHVFRRGLMRPDRLHAAATGYVRAEAQSAAFGVLWDELSPDEQAVARRGKKSSDHVDAPFYI